MSLTSTSSVPPRPMPARANIEYLKNEAKRRLAAQRPTHPNLKLSAVQFELARECGFASWRAMKAALDDPHSGDMTPDAVGDWIAQLAHTRVALHVRTDGVTMDSPSYGSFGFAVHGFEASGDRMTFNLPRVNGSFQGVWSVEAQAWCGTWRQDGVDYPVDLRRGVFPTAPILAELDGIWEGLFDDQLARLVFRVATDRHGTFATCDSPDRSGYNLPVEAIERQDDRVTFQMKTVVVTGTLDASGTALSATLTRGETVHTLTLRCRLPGESPLALPAIDLPAELLPRYTGEFGPTHWRVIITLGKDGLIARFPNGDAVDMVPIREDEFCFRRGVGRLLFDIEPDGSVSGLVFRLQGRDSPGKRYR